MVLRSRRFHCSTTTFLGSSTIFFTASMSLNREQYTSAASSGDRHSVNFMFSMAVGLTTGRTSSATIPETHSNTASKADVAGNLIERLSALGQGGPGRPRPPAPASGLLRAGPPADKCSQVLDCMERPEPRSPCGKPLAPSCSGVGQVWRGLVDRLTPAPRRG